MLRSARTALAAILLASITASTGCTDDDPTPPTSSPPAAPPTAPFTTVVRVDPVSPGTECPGGGSVVRAGPDTDGDGTLDPGEVVTRRLLCDGATLVSTERVAPGTSCDAGGTAVHTGPDRDADGVLDADEILSTSTVCAEVVRGDLEIRSDDDLRRLRQIGGVTGDLTFAVNGLGAVELPDLVFIGGHVRVRDVSGLTRLALDHLQLAAGVTVERSADLAEIALPALTLCPDLRIVANPSLAALRLPALTSIGTAELTANPLTSLDLSGVRTARRLDIQGSAEAAIELPALATAGVLELEGASSRFVSAPLLVEVGSLWVVGNPSLEGIDLRSLRVADMLDISRNLVLTELDLGGLALVRDFFTLVGNPRLTAFDHRDARVGFARIQANDRLERVAFTIERGSLDVQGNRALTRLDVDVREASAVYLYDVALTEVDFAHLRAVQGFQIGKAPALTRVSLPALETARALVVSDAPTLTTLTAPVLREVQDQLWLERLGLRTCAADALVEQLDVVPAHIDIRALSDAACE